MSSSPRHGSSASQHKHPKSSSTHSRNASQTPRNNDEISELPGRYYIPRNELDELVLEMGGVHGSADTDIHRIGKVKENLDKYQNSLERLEGYQRLQAAGKSPDEYKETQERLERYQILRDIKAIAKRIHYMKHLESAIVSFANDMIVNEELENKDFRKLETRVSRLKETMNDASKVLEAAKSQMNDDTFNKKTLGISDGDKEEEMKAVCKEGKEKIEATRKLMKEHDDKIKSAQKTV
ncbi:uncharacterized protein FOMMEDRAFT_25624 [Fomitiporia mediterranea MF3/22]|uniref:uncharacterized protein n=1 Tax=Fomitiporia mediterranea (strain MF3/22) TaxID=694068 RepID=UPI0004408917|nr:uncharacterized protein FOMMEDRAFT_25624 [Fomitiporia mediterranea MF3/22]EJD06308.1 hypothetical protein FOMMEDRAFT_25624 [Fomitiporia mediterranea MF3/22]